MSDDRVKWYRKILSEDPTSRIFVELAEVLYAQGHYPEVAEVCREGLHLHPASKRARVLLGLALWQQGEAAGAEQELTIVQKDLEKNAPIYKVLAEIHWQKGQPGRACKLMDIYLNFQPGDMQARSTRHQWEEQIRNPPLPPKASESEPTPEPAADRHIPTVSAEPTILEQNQAPDVPPFKTHIEQSPEPASALEALVELEEPQAEQPRAIESEATTTELEPETPGSGLEPAAESATHFNPPPEQPEMVDESAGSGPDLTGALQNWQARLMKRPPPPDQPEPVLDGPSRTTLRRLLRGDS